ncbi:MAG: NAD(P)/FAD-dependent oxidoreductase [Acidiferrobacterales bacterium]|nr:NAD(P)/FAD-dependent oxidoreductase [Acidiferrobacterales bacterium]
MNAKLRDVVIAGGGLAGLTLAHQLKRSQPELDIVVIEKGTFPKPEKTAKVGESTVEIGSHYLNHTLDLKQHFTERHLRKHGLRCFFGESQSDFSQQDELGVSELFGIPAYQIDRGAIENYLQELVISEGVELIDGANTSDLEISDAEKAITVSSAAGQQRIQSRWIVDAAGRQSLVKNKLGLHKDSAHKGNALWFRIDRQIKLDSWSDDSQWQERIKQENTRWLSTNHLMGPGYWVWVIPLDNGATSIGIVMDDEAFASHDFSNYESTFEWLSKHHTRCAEAIDGAEVLDYVVINDYSLDCKQMFSDQGWGLTGESGVFADPFYSPGSDFIALNNSFITKLIDSESRGQDIRLDSRVFQTINQSFFNSTLSLYTEEYGGFGDRRMMALKLVWDYAYYWGVLSLLFFRSAMVDVSLMRELNPTLSLAYEANKRVQALFRQRAKQRKMLAAQGLFMDQYQVPCLRHYNEILKQTMESNDVSTQVLLKDNVDKLERIASYIENMLSDKPDTKISQDEQELLGDYRRVVLA